MFKTTVNVDGMVCGMCEAHINDVVRKTYPEAKKVSSSARKKETVFLTDNQIDPSLLQKAIDATGYKYISSKTENYEKKSLFSRK